MRMTDISILLRRHRRSRDLTLARMGSRLGVTGCAVWAWERGTVIPPDSRIEAIADDLHLSPREADQLLRAAAEARRERAEARGGR